MAESVNKYKEFREKIPGDIDLVVVSKTHPVDEILSLYQAGHRKFGENKVQELTGKYESLPADIQWHMVGHLQRNKVKYIAPFISMIQSVDSKKLLNTIEKEGAKNDRIIDCLLQLHIAEEESKFGFSEDELFDLMNGIEQNNYLHVNIRGLMGMATFTDDDLLVRQEFRKMKKVFDRLVNKHLDAHPGFNVISMGMSNDYNIALEEGATMIRIGSKIFGERNYL